MTFVSLIVPVFNEEKVLPTFYDELVGVLDNVDFRSEIIFVDDGSADNTWASLKQLRSQDSRIKLLCLSRNFGHQAALLAGIENAKGECVITMDGDLEHPPELIPVLVNKWRQGAKIVNTRRRSSAHLPIGKKLTSSLFYKIFRFLSGLELNPGMADYRLLDQQVITELKGIKEKALFLRGILQWVGFEQEIVDYEAGSRSVGKSKFSLTKMTQLALNAITAFSTIPLRVATLLGFVFSMISFSYLAYAAYAWMFTDYSAEGWKAVIGLLLFLGGVQLICIGIIGEYLGRVYLEVKERPAYIVKLNEGFEND